MAGLYLHIPFCRNKCLYCDFYSGNQLYLIDEYVDALIIEIKVRAHYLGESKIDTIYFGGGTPSLLNEVNLSKILCTIFNNFQVEESVEITLECNPEDINGFYIKDLIDIGINRISLGVQFLDDRILKQFKRNHTKTLIFKALECINNSKIVNLSLDLIYSVPGIGDADLKKSLVELMHYDIKHISAYSLTIAKESQLYWKLEKGEFIENKEETFLNQYFLVRDYLISLGFIQYEISNYAKEGYYSRHNMGYWNQLPYLGVGVSAHSYNHYSRQWNHKSIKKYIRDLKESNFVRDFEREELTEVDRYNEYILLKLRTPQGLSNGYILDHFNLSIVNHFLFNINILIRAGHFEVGEDLFIPRSNDLLIGDYLAKKLMV